MQQSAVGESSINLSGWRRRHWIQKTWGWEVAFVRQTTATFRRRRLWVSKTPILPINFPKMLDLRPKITIFGIKIFPQNL